MKNNMDISVIICTANRADSLRQTLECLARADRDHLHVDIIVVDNLGQKETRAVVRCFSRQLPLRYLTADHAGKSYCLNRALDEGGLGRVVAILDDDMSPRKDWFQGIMATVREHPEFDIFGGRIKVIFPGCAIPGWARHPAIRGMAHSAVDRGEKDTEMAPGEFPSGNHFFLRAKVFADGDRFDHLWATEPELVLRLRSRGFRGLWAGRVMAAHRIQENLLDETHLRKRAALFGRSTPHFRRDYYRAFPEEMLHENHRLTWFVCRTANLGRWLGVYVTAWLTFSRDKRVVRQLRAICGMAHNFERLRITLKHGHNDISKEA